MITSSTPPLYSLVRNDWTISEDGPYLKIFIFEEPHFTPNTKPMPSKTFDIRNKNMSRRFVVCQS